jgi:hypothetical protein
MGRGRDLGYIAFMTMIDGALKLGDVARRFGALLFLATVILAPVAIVLFEPGRGGIWVAGYVTGMITVPLVAIGAIRAIYALFERTALDVFVAFVVFGSLVTLVSIAAILWAFLGPGG